jgi:hypothetical protein
MAIRGVYSRHLSGAYATIEGVSPSSIPQAKLQVHVEIRIWTSYITTIV